MSTAVSTAIAPVVSPATPKTSSKAVATASPTGTWRHPQMDEINRRIGNRTFGERNFQAIFWNALAIIGSFVSPHFCWRYFPSIARIGAHYTPYSAYLLYFIRISFLINVVLALRPIILRPDDLSDIPLTPSQRNLLGLPQSATPLTPGSHYSTPPRYARSTPRSSSSTRAQPGTAARSATSSPLSARGYGSPAERGRQSPTNSPTPFGRESSPLFQRKFGEDPTRRLSYGSQSPLRTSHLLGESATVLGGSAPGTPTPATGARGTPSVALNNKWLYERRRESMGGSPGFS